MEETYPLEQRMMPWAWTGRRHYLILRKQGEDRCGTFLKSPRRDIQKTADEKKSGRSNIRVPIGAVSPLPEALNNGGVPADGIFLLGTKRQGSLETGCMPTEGVVMVEKPAARHKSERVTAIGFLYTVPGWRLKQLAAFPRAARGGFRKRLSSPTRGGQNQKSGPYTGSRPASMGQCTR